MQVPVRRTCAALLVTWAVLVALADYLFFVHEPGWTLGLYALLLALAMLVRHGRRMLGEASGRIAAAALPGLVVALVVDPGVIAFFLVSLALLHLSLAAEDRRRGLWAWIRAYLLSGVCGWTRIFLDAYYARRRHRSHGSWRRAARVLGRWVAPVLLTLVFLGLFSVANPILHRWTSEAVDCLARWLSRLQLPSLERCLFWVLVGVWLWPFLRARWAKTVRDLRRKALRSLLVPSGGCSPSSGPRTPRPFPGPTAGFAVRCLVPFNALFLLQNLLDARYLWAGSHLPEGMTYAQYAHRGAYPLVVTALLAAVFVLATFSPKAETSRHNWARGLVYLWLAQNVVLTASAAYRLALYVDAYSLTRLRFAAAVWMGLVAAGLLSIARRIVKSHSNEWLVGRNLSLLGLVLYCLCFVNVDGIIASYNVGHCKEIGGAGAELDLSYIARLGPEALPALRWYGDSVDDPAKAAHAGEAVAQLERRLHRQLADWRGWTWDRWRLARPVLPASRNESTSSGSRP